MLNRYQNQSFVENLIFSIIEAIFLAALAARTRTNNIAAEGMTYPYRPLRISTATYNHK